jgi:hypothetical protein
VSRKKDKPTQDNTRRSEPYGVEEVEDELGSVGNEEREGLVDAVDGQHGIAAHIGVAVLEVGAHGGHQRLEDLCLLELAQEAQRAAPHVLVRVVEIVTEVRAVRSHSSC